MKNSLKNQVGGRHYADMKMQPIVFAMANNFDPCAFSILKYVSRFQSKSGRADLLKGRHFVDLRLDLVQRVHNRGIPVISIEEYISTNEIMCPDTQEGLRSVFDWVYHTRFEPITGFILFESPAEAERQFHERSADRTRAAIDEIIRTYYPNSGD